jgi:hypothetical protein
MSIFILLYSLLVARFLGLMGYLVLIIFGSPVSGGIYPQIAQITQILFLKIGEICEICG